MEAAAFFKMDIFFVVTTVVVFGVGVLFVVLLYYLVRVARDVSEISARVKEEANSMVDDVRDMREDIKEGFDDIKDGLGTIKRYKGAAAGANIVRSISNLMQAFVTTQDDDAPPKRRRGGRTRR